MRNTAPIRSEDPAAVEQLRERIAQAELRQAMMRIANKIVRDKTLNEEAKLARLAADCGMQIFTARSLLKPDFAGRLGYPAFELTNNSANIRRMQDRLEALTRESARPSVEVAFPGGRMEDDASGCRVRIFHDVKPAPGVIQQLKANGFHWSPSHRAWQRLRNESARSAAARVTGATWPDLAAAPQPAASLGAAPSVATSPVRPAPAPRIAG